MSKVLSVVTAICISSSAFASVNLCGLPLQPGVGQNSVDYVYYQIDSFKPAFATIFGRQYKSEVDCWADVKSLIGNTEIVKTYGFLERGAPPDFRRWYVGWFNNTFLNNDPNVIPSNYEKQITNAKPDQI